MPKTTFDLNIPLTQSTKPLYAGVGVTDLVVEVVRDYVTEAQRLVADVQKSVSGLDYQPQAWREQATKVVTARVEARRKAVEDRVNDLQKRMDDNLAAANGAYTDLVERGESLVGRIRRQESTKQTVSSAKTTTAKARTTRTQASKTAASTTSAAKKSVKKAAKKSPARSSAKATKTSATKTASSAARAVAGTAQKVGD